MRSFHNRHRFQRLASRKARRAMLDDGRHEFTRLAGVRLHAHERVVTGKGWQRRLCLPASAGAHTDFAIHVGGNNA